MAVLLLERKDIFQNQSVFRLICAEYTLEQVSIIHILRDCNTYLETQSLMRRLLLIKVKKFSQIILFLQSVLYLLT